MQASPEGQLHEVKKFVDFCGEVGRILNSIHEGLEIYHVKRESATLEEFEQLNQVFVTALPAMREILDGFNKEYVGIVKTLGGKLIYDEEQ